MSMYDPLRAQSFRTQRAELPEDLWQPLYDSVNYAAAGASELAFFATQRGQSATLIRAGTAAAVTKTYRDTNMDNAGVVPLKMYKFIGISIGMRHEDEGEVANPTDRDNIRSGGYIHWKIGDKDILLLPLMFLPEANPIIIGSTTATSTTLIGSAGGGGMNVPMYKLPIPVTLNPYENFTFKILFDGTVTTTKSVDVIVVLQGFMRRPS